MATVRSRPSCRGWVPLVVQRLQRRVWSCCSSASLLGLIADRFRGRMARRAYAAAGRRRDRRYGSGSGPAWTGVPWEQVEGVEVERARPGARRSCRGTPAREASMLWPVRRLRSRLAAWVNRHVLRDAAGDAVRAEHHRLVGRRRRLAAAAGGWPSRRRLARRAGGPSAGGARSRSCRVSDAARCRRDAAGRGAAVDGHRGARRSGRLAGLAGVRRSRPRRRRSRPARPRRTASPSTSSPVESRDLRAPDVPLRPSVVEPGPHEPPGARKSRSVRRSCIRPTAASR